MPVGLYEANLSVALAPGHNVRRGDIVDIDDEALANRLLRRGYIRPYRDPYLYSHPVLPPDEVASYSAPPEPVAKAPEPEPEEEADDDEPYDEPDVDEADGDVDDEDG